jgi:hypothetical protein
MLTETASFLEIWRPELQSNKAVDAIFFIFYDPK